MEMSVQLYTHLAIYVIFKPVMSLDIIIMPGKRTKLICLGIYTYLIWWQQKTIRSRVSQLNGEACSSVLIISICIVRVKPDVHSFLVSILLYVAIANCTLTSQMLCQ